MYPLSNACGQLGQSYQVSFVDMKTLVEGSCTKIAVENTNSSQQPRVNSRASFSFACHGLTFLNDAYYLFIGLSLQ